MILDRLWALTNKVPVSLYIVFARVSGLLFFSAYEVTVEDPTVWTAPWTVRQELKRQNEEQNRIYYEPRCHEGNYGLAAMFIGARRLEEAFSAGQGPDPFSLDTTTGGGGAR